MLKNRVKIERSQQKIRTYPTQNKHNLNRKSNNNSNCFDTVQKFAFEKKRFNDDDGDLDDDDDEE